MQAQFNTVSQQQKQYIETMLIKQSQQFIQQNSGEMKKLKKLEKETKEEATQPQDDPSTNPLAPA